MKIQKIDSVRSVSKKADLLLDSRPQFPFIGRSNVGKSSLLNCMAGRRRLAPVSKSPGRTRKIHYYLLNEEVYFVDLPGYGYAKLPQTVREHWAKLIEAYLQLAASCIPFVVLLLDIRHKPSERDLQLITWMAHYNVSVQVVLTKSDKIKRGHIAKQQSMIAKGLVEGADKIYKPFIKDQITTFPPIPFSAESGQGRQQLFRVVDAVRKGELP